MTTWYIDSNWSGPHEGTEANPYKDFNQMTLADGDTALLKAGSRFTRKLEIKGITATVGAYGSGEMPIISNYQVSDTEADWLQLTQDVWVLDLGTNKTFDFATGLGLGELGVRKPMVDYFGVNSDPQMFTETGQTAYQATGVDNSLFAVYAPPNPVKLWGKVWYGTKEEYGIKVKMGSAYISGIRFEDCWTGIIFTMNGATQDATVHITDCVFARCYRPIGVEGQSSFDVVDMLIKNNLLSDSGGPGVYLNGTYSGGEVSRNTIVNSCLTYSTAGIYMGRVHGDKSAPLLIHGNTVENVDRGNWWKHDGDGIYHDNEGSYVIVYNNTVSGVHDGGAGLRNNAGTSHTRWTQNHVVDCSIGARCSNSPRDQVYGLTIDNNIFNGVDTGLQTTNSAVAGWINAFDNTFIGTGSGVGIQESDGSTLSVIHNNNNFTNFNEFYRNVPPGIDDKWIGKIET